MDAAPTPASTRSEGTRARLRGWCILGAAVALLYAGWHLGVWGNHWYVAEHFHLAAIDSADPGEAGYWEVSRLLRSGNVALRNGVVALTVLAGLAVAARRLGRPTRPAP